MNLFTAWLVEKSSGLRSGIEMNTVFTAALWRTLIGFVKILFRVNWIVRWKKKGRKVLRGCPKIINCEGCLSCVCTGCDMCLFAWMVIQGKMLEIDSVFFFFFWKCAIFQLTSLFMQGIYAINLFWVPTLCYDIHEESDR